MNHHATSPAKLASRALIALALITSIFAINASRAAALPGALHIAIVHSLCVTSGGTNYADDFANGLRAEPGVTNVTMISAGQVAYGGSGTTPTLQSLDGIDAVVALSDCPWADSAALGNVLADFQDRGGVVIAPNDNFWSESADPGFALLGRWASGGYSPIVQNIAQAESGQPLGGFDNTNPIFAGVPTLGNGYTYSAATAAPGAITIANWGGGAPAVVLKGQAVGYNGWLGDGNGGNGYDAKLIVNAINALGPKTISVGISGNGKGAINNGGCTKLKACTIGGIPGRVLPVQALELEGSVFTGWTGACTGNAPICQITVGYPGIVAATRLTPALSASFALTKIKVGGFKNGKLTVTLPGAGKLVVKGSGIKSLTQKFKGSGKVKLALKATGSAKKKLAKGKSAKVKLKIAYTPTGASSAASFKDTVKLKP